MIIPAAIALGEAEGVSGSILIPAIVAGYEVMGRVGGKASPHSVRKGFRGSPTYGPFGVAAAAGKVLGLTPNKWGTLYHVQRVFHWVSGNSE